MELQLVPAIAAGIAGTLAMTALMTVAPMMGLPKMNVVGMLGSMITPDESTARTAGIAMHLAMGVIFALVYAFLWGQGLTIGAGSWALNGLVYGLVHGVIAIVTMPMMMSMHPRPPEMAKGPMAMAGMLAGHIVFGLVVAGVYTMMAA